MKVVIDPGHGGQDPGASGPASVEKNIVLSIAQKIPEYLAGHGIDVLMTRGNDILVSLADRCSFANKAGADAFVSVHCNAGPPTAHGLEVFHYPGSDVGKRLADFVRTGVLRLTPFADRGIKEARYYVLRHTVAPACLIECGFLTNMQDEEWLISEGVQTRIAQGIAAGIARFFNVPWVNPWETEQQQAMAALAKKARFNQPHKPDEVVNLGLLAVIFKRMGLV